MKLSFSDLQERPHLFKQLTGLTIPEFLTICSQLAPLWQEAFETTKRGHGRNSLLVTLEDKALPFFVYLNTNIGFEELGRIFGLHSSSIWRLVRKLEQLMTQLKIPHLKTKSQLLKESLAELAKYESNQ